MYENWLDELPGRASLAIASRVSGIARDNVDLMRIQSMARTIGRSEEVMSLS